MLAASPEKRSLMRARTAPSIAAMALSTCILQLRTPAARSLNGLGGAVSIVFALVFFGLVFHWIHLDPDSPAQSLVWLSSYFGFTAICLFAFAWSLRESVVK